MKAKTFEQCHKAFPEWVDSSMADFTFDDPKGFSSFTMGIRSKKAVQPTAVLYRRLEGKENAILDYEIEKELFLMLGAHNIAAPRYRAYTEDSLYPLRAPTIRQIFADIQAKI